MSRSGYSDDGGDCGDEWAQICWRGATLSSLRGKRGQTFLRELLAALDALPEPRLIKNKLKDGGDVCAFGAVGRLRGIDLPEPRHDPLDDEYGPEDMSGEVSALFDTNDKLTREVMWVNDEGGLGRKVPIPNIMSGAYGFGYVYLPETPEERWVRVRKWVANQIKELTP